MSNAEIIKAANWYSESFDSSYFLDKLKRLENRWTKRTKKRLCKEVNTLFNK